MGDIVFHVSDYQSNSVLIQAECEGDEVQAGKDKPVRVVGEVLL